jgi:1-acyl-sn-glycerol-3-phosphate acyltransferase
MQRFVTENEYHTPENTPRYWGDKLALNTRVYFMLRYMAIITRASMLIALHRFNAAQFMRTNLSIFRLIEGCNGRFHITGLDNIRNCQGPVVIVSNHMSNIESNSLGWLIRPHMKMTYVVKATLLKFPIFGPVVSYVNPIPVGRANPRQDLQTVLEEGVKRLKDGISVILFPQSTRNYEFVPAQFNSLGVKLARKADVPILPVAVKTDFWGNGRFFWRDFGPLNRDEPIHVAFGEPFMIEGSSKQAHEHVLDFIQCHLERWGVPIIS